METTNGDLKEFGQKPCFIDGRLSEKTYLVVAAKPKQQAETYNAIGVRKLDDDYFRIHVYPNFEFFGLEVPKDRYRRTLHGYEGCYMCRKQLDEFLLGLSGRRGLVTAPLEEAPKVMGRGFNSFSDLYAK